MTITIIVAYVDQWRTICFRYRIGRNSILFSSYWPAPTGPAEQYSALRQPHGVRQIKQADRAGRQVGRQTGSLVSNIVVAAGSNSSNTAVTADSNSSIAVILLLLLAAVAELLLLLLTFDSWSSVVN